MHRRKELLEEILGKEMYKERQLKTDIRQYNIADTKL
jgi:hypothetical protein